MPSRRTLKYYIVLSLLFHAALAEVAVLVPVPAKTSDDVMVVNLADIPRSTDFLRPKPGIVKGARPVPPRRRPVPPPKIRPDRPIVGRVPDLPVNPALPPEKEFPIPRAKSTMTRNPEPAKTASAPKAQEESQRKETAGTGGPASRPPPPRTADEPRSLRDMTPSLGKMVLARTETGTGRGRNSSPGTAVETGGRAEKTGPIVEAQSGGAHLTSLNAPEIQYISYFAGIKRKIELVWQYPYDAQIAGIQGDLVVEFVIGRDGRLDSVELVRGSGRKILDDEAINAIRKAAPYDPIPKEYKIPELKIHGHFIYEMNTLRIR